MFGSATSLPICLTHTGKHTGNADNNYTYENNEYNKDIFKIQHIFDFN